MIESAIVTFMSPLDRSFFLLKLLAMDILIDDVKTRDSTRAKVTKYWFLIEWYI